MYRNYSHKTENVRLGNTSFVLSGAFKVNDSQLVNFRGDRRVECASLDDHWHEVFDGQS